MTDTDELTTTKPALRADAQRNRIRILDAAESVFAELGATASTEEVASRAGVAIGTVFRHFPTKRDLLAAIMTDLRCRLTAQARTLAVAGDPTTALFDFATSLVELATTKRTVVELLTDAAGQVGSLQQAVDALLVRAQQAGVVRPDARIADVMALLGAASQGTLRGGWDRQARDRTLSIIFDGLRTGAMGTIEVGQRQVG
ncbi:MAG TPA: helix-turn-helix domain-containing protein [Pseudonocardiaceae bacterium]|jgi:AcrR family transcriptional regulator|nr:helix-turn-helix domain-containing protein [Pseudonocardiaceae bacterium]